MKNFKKLLIWQKGMQIVELTYQLTATFPDYEKYSLSNQCQRSAVSVASNIAEGSGRSGTKDQKRFIEISLGSLYELETQLRISARLGYSSERGIKEILDIVEEEQKMLFGYIRALNTERAIS